MSGESEPKKAKDNTGLEPKPEGVQQPGAAPKGHLGHKPASPAPGGTTQARTVTQKLEQSGRQQAQPVEDTRPIAVKTGDEQIDKQSEENGQQVMSMDDIKAKAHGEDASQKSEGPQVSQSDYAKAFRQAVGEQERQKQQQQSKGFDLE
ncbi:hypothetical protein [Fluviibacterium sp. S390]|uniref:hypothetical protein n=1 Tax=Fluviibacterium sp. S390 TaxID=3415139 RepID=UPI003C7A5FFF